MSGKVERVAQFLGILGLVLTVFGLLTQLLVSEDEYHLVHGHLIIGALCLIVFLAGGGQRALSSATAKRVAGFGAGVFLYSLLFVALLGCLNYIVLRHDPLFVDTTADKLYTLAPQTESLLSGLTRPVVARAFYVGKIDAEAEALLNRYAKSPNFRWIFIDPEQKPKLMEDFGVSQSATVHFSFADEPAGRSTKIVRDITEQEITNSIIKLTRGGEKKVYVLTGHGEADLTKEVEAGFLYLKEAIEGENIAVSTLNFSETHTVPTDASAVMVLAPRKSLLPIEMEALAVYLKQGGRALFAAEPKTTTDIAELVKPYGISIGNDLVVDQVVGLFAGPSLGVQPMVSSFAKHPATLGFDKNIAFSTASSVTRVEPLLPGTTVTELAFSGRNSWAESDLEKIFAEEPTATLEESDLRGPVPIVVAYEGALPTNPGEQQGRIVVVGDIDFVANINLRKLYNADFFLNLLNWTVGEDQGVTIRSNTRRASRAVITREQFSAIFLVSGILFPEALLLAGLGVWWMRKRD